MKRKAVIISILGKYLTNKEKKLISVERPWGIILFKRNIFSFKQTKRLIKSIKKASNNKNFPVLIDEEGGAVTRLSKIINNNIYSQKYFGDLFANNKKISISVYKKYIFSVCIILKDLGININTVPVLDILKKKTHKIIGNRSYSKTIGVIKELGLVCVNSYKKNRIGTVIKHIPGHGCASSDSHLVLPVVNDSYKKLSKADFLCFSKIDSHFAMTAHILYKKLDPINVATQSKKIIMKIIRKKIGFKGILISDDISMKALKDDIISNARKSLEAGCNLVLYCSGKHRDSLKLLKEMPFIDSFTKKKTSEFYKFLS